MTKVGAPPFARTPLAQAAGLIRSPETEIEARPIVPLGPAPLDASAVASTVRIALAQATASRAVMMGVMVGLGAGVVPVATAAAATPTDGAAGAAVDVVPANPRLLTLIDKGRDKVKELAWSELARERGVDVAKLTLGDYGSVGLRLSEKIFAPDDPAVRDDVLRRSTTAAMKAQGESPVWIRTAGIIEANAGLSHSFPISGGVTGSVGFATSGAVEYRTTQPYRLPVGKVAEDLLLNNTIALPVTAKNAQAMQPGAELELTGRGSASLSGGAGFGASASVGAVTARLDLSANKSHTESGVYNVKVLRLDGERVFVTVTELAQEQDAQGIGLRAGLSLDTSAFVKGLGDKPFERLGENALRKQVEDYVAKLTALDAGVSSSSSEGSRSVAAFTFDLANPAARAAYEALLGLDVASADGAAHLSGTGVDVVTYNELTQTAGHEGHITLAGHRLLLDRALREETEGVLKDNRSTQILRTSRYTQDDSGIFSGDRSIVWEGVSVSDAKGADQGSFFHLSFKNDDKNTHAYEAKQFLGLARVLHAVEDTTLAQAQPESHGFWSRLFSSKDNAQVEVDVYFTHEGAQKIAATSREEAFEVYVRASEKVSPSLIGVPRAGEALTAVEKYNQLVDVQKEVQRGDTSRLREVEVYGTDSFQQASSEVESRKSEAARDYRKAFGRNIERDAEIIRGATSFSTHIGRLAGVEDDDQWAKLFGDFGQATGFHYTRALAAMGELAGQADTIVHKLSMKGDGVDIQAKDEGLLKAPSDIVSDALKAPLP